MAQSTHCAVIGVPANNTTMEPELNALCPDLAPFAVARVKLPAGTLKREDLSACAASTLVAIEPFLASHTKLVVQGCTAAGFLAGPAENARIVEAVGRVTGAPVRDLALRAVTGRSKALFSAAVWAVMRAGAA